MGGGQALKGMGLLSEVIKYSKINCGDNGTPL